MINIADRLGTGGQIPSDSAQVQAKPAQRIMLSDQQASSPSAAVQPNPDRTYVGQQRIRVYVAQPRAR